MPIRNNQEHAFADRVRNLVRVIPRGEVRTYKEIADLAGNPKAARAVARVMSLNYDINIPCHRVIRSDGSLGGYNRGGTTVKHKLLTDEGWLQQTT